MECKGEKAYCLTKLEFAVILAASGINGIYSFRLPGENEISREDILTSLCGLAKRGLIEADGEIRLSDEIRAYADIVRRSDRVLSVIPRTAGSQKICYLSDESAVLTELGEQEGEIRISSPDKDVLWELLMNEEEMPWSVLPMDDAAGEQSAYLDLAEDEYKRIQGMEPLPMEDPIFDWFENEQVLGAWELLSPDGDLVHRRWMFLWGGSNHWILMQEPGCCEVWLDSISIRQKLRSWVIE